LIALAATEFVRTAKLCVPITDGPGPEPKFIQEMWPYGTLSIFAYALSLDLALKPEFPDELWEARKARSYRRLPDLTRPFDESDDSGDDRAYGTVGKGTGPLNGLFAACAQGLDGIQFSVFGTTENEYQRIAYRGWPMEVIYGLLWLGAVFYEIMGRWRWANPIIDNVFPRFGQEPQTISADELAALERAVSMLPCPDAPRSIEQHPILELSIPGDGCMNLSVRRVGPPMPDRIGGEIPPTPHSHAGGAPPSSRKSKRALAIYYRLQNPTWTDAEVAAKAGCHVKSLYRWRDYADTCKDLTKHGDISKQGLQVLLSGTIGNGHQAPARDRKPR